MYVSKQNIDKYEKIMNSVKDQEMKDNLSKKIDVLKKNKSVLK